MVGLRLYQFFRLCRKPAQGAGRRYYKLVCYPQDVCELPDNNEAQNYAAARHYAAILTPSHQWITLNDKARQCVQWHEAGKDGYVDVL